MTARLYDEPIDPRSQSEELPGEDELARFPIVASQYASKDRAGLVLGGALALFLGAASFVMLASGREGEEPAPASSAAANPADPLALEADPAKALAPSGQAAQPAPALPPMPPVTLQTQPPAASPPVAALMQQNRAGSPAVIYDVGQSSRDQTVVAAAPPSAPKTRQATGPLTADEQFAARLMDSEVPTSSATRMGNLAAIIPQGTLIPGVLETAIDTDVPGFVRAVISRDVRSFDGSRVLIPRGSRVIGQYKSGLAIGQTRAFVVWTRIIRPDGVTISISSPATDTSGRNGLGGKVDSHFGKRFGAALLMSLIGAAGQAAGGGTSVILSGTQSAVSASTGSNANIPPTVRVALGQPIRIFTAQDLDFSAVTP